MGDDVHAEIEIRCHAPHESKLLIILLAEHGDVRPGRGEQLRDHGGHPVEVTRTRTSLHRFAQPIDVHGGGEPRRIHRRCRGGVHRVDAGGLARSEVVVERARVVVEVAVLTELQGIDEDRHQHSIGVLPGSIDQGEVSAVQRPHGGYESNRLTGETHGVRPGAHTGRCVDHDGHSTNATSQTPNDLESAVRRTHRHRGTPVHHRSWSRRRRRGHRRPRTCLQRHAG